MTNVIEERKSYVDKEIWDDVVTKLIERVTLDNGQRLTPRQAQEVIDQLILLIVARRTEFCMPSHLISEAWGFIALHGSAYSALCNGEEQLSNPCDELYFIERPRVGEITLMKVEETIKLLRNIYPDQLHEETWRLRM